MGESTHKSRKRERSVSSDRMVKLERKISQLIEALSEREVGEGEGREESLMSPPPGEASSFFLTHQVDRESGGERLSNAILMDNYSIPEEPVSDEGVYELPNSVLTDRNVDITYFFIFIGQILCLLQ